MEYSDSADSSKPSDPQVDQTDANDKELSKNEQKRIQK